MEVVARLLTAVVVAVVGLAVSGVTKSILVDHFMWEDCGPRNDTKIVLHVQTLNVTSPLSIPGNLTIKSLQASLSAPLPADVIIQFRIHSNSSFGPEYPVNLPCFPDHGGSCAYKVCDLVTLTQQSSRVTQQVVQALKTTCPINGPLNITLSDVTITIPPMVASPLDTFINTNNYYVTVKLLSGNDTLGCLKLTMPVQKACLGWLCPTGIDPLIEYWNSD